MQVEIRYVDNPERIYDYIKDVIDIVIKHGIDYSVFEVFTKNNTYLYNTKVFTFKVTHYD